MSAFENAKFKDTGEELSFKLEKCGQIPAEIEYDKYTLYIKSIRLIKKKEFEAPSKSSAVIKTLEKQLIKKLSIFKGHRRMSRSTNSVPILNVFRISHNYSDIIYKDITPAMKAGLEIQPLSLEQLISLKL